MLRSTLLTAAAAAALVYAPAAFAQMAPTTPPVPTQTPMETPATSPDPATAPEQVVTPAPAPAQAATPAATAQANNVIDVLKANGEFTTLLSALDQAQLTNVLASRPAITIFAPTDAAFAAMPEAERTRLLDPANAQELRSLLLYHVIVADVTTSQIDGARGPVATAGGAQVEIDGSGDGIKIDAAKVLQAEMDASNGGVYAIDRVLNPAGSQAAQGDTDALTTAPTAPATTPPADTAPPATAAPSETTPAPDGAVRPADPGENAPTGEPASTVTTTAAPPVPNPTDGQVDDEEDPANPVPTPTPN